MEIKSLPIVTKSVDGRTVTGVFAVHGNRDSYDDISHPGSFAKTIAERMSRVKFLWNHDYYGGPPIAIVKSIREVMPNELPEKVLELAPGATGGVEISREYLKNDRAEAVFEAVTSGASDEMSYGYDAVKMDFSEVDGIRVRNLREIRLWEVSDVIFGANPATAGSKLHMPIDLLMKQLQAHIEEIKAGARHSSKDIAHLNAIHAAILELGATNCKGVIDESTDEADKSRAEATAPSLTHLFNSLKELELGVMTL